MTTASLTSLQSTPSVRAGLFGIPISVYGALGFGIAMLAVAPVWYLPLTVTVFYAVASDLLEHKVDPWLLLTGSAGMVAMVFLGSDVQVAFGVIALVLLYGCYVAFGVDGMMPVVAALAVALYAPLMVPVFLGALFVAQLSHALLSYTGPAAPMFLGLSATAIMVNGF